MISICLLRQLKAQLLSSHLPHKFAQTGQIQVANITGRLLYSVLNVYAMCVLLRTYDFVV